MKQLLFLTLSLVVSPGVLGLNLADVACGKMAKGSRRYHQRIMGGSSAQISDFPYAVSLKKHGEHFCGGSLLNQHYVVTAAHCVHGYAPDVWTVSVGDQNSAIVEDHEQVIKVEDIIKHPDYKWPKFVNDIALLRLSTPVQWNDRVQPICLPDTVDKNVEGTFAYLAGWGLDNEKEQGGQPTEDLQFTRLPILENDQCQDWFKKAGKKVKVTQDHICAGYEEGQQDGCQGDSGGGLVTASSGTMQIVGVMSAGIGCGRAGLPGMYTRINSFVPWVQKTISEWHSIAKRDTNNLQWWTGIDLEQRRALLQQHLLMMDSLPLLSYPYLN